MQTKSRTSLVLMELIITVFFFAICSAVCIQLFVNSHIISNKASELNKAVSKAQSFAEVMRGTDGSFEEITKVFSNVVITGTESFEVYYDKDFKEISNKNDALYLAEVSLSEVEKIQQININIVKIKPIESNEEENIDDIIAGDVDGNISSDLDEKYELIYSLKATKRIK